MKKSLLLLSLLFGATATQAATVEDICGTYNVDSFTGLESYWWHKTTTFEAFSWDNYTVEISQVEGNTVVLTGLLEADITGEYDAENSCIVFPFQDPYGGGGYYFCKEIIDDENQWVMDPAESVIAPIDAEGNITFDDWTIVYDYGNGTYFYYFSGTKASLSPYVPAICGTYNVDKFEGYDAGMFNSNAEDWIYFSKSDYDVTITPVKGNEVSLNNLVNKLSFYGEYNPEESTITFPAQQVYGPNYPNYWLCAELWNDEDYMIFDSFVPMVATISEDGIISFPDWTIAYVYDDGLAYGYFSWITCLLSPKTTGIKDTISNSESVSGPTLYYTLNGIQVNQDNLRPGIYIVRQGNQARKVLVK